MAESPLRSFPKFSFDLRSGYKQITNYRQKIGLNSSTLLDKLPVIPKSKDELIFMANNAIDSIEEEMRRLHSIVHDAVLTNGDKILSSLPNNSSDQLSSASKAIEEGFSCPEESESENVSENGSENGSEIKPQLELENSPLFLHQPRLRKSNRSLLMAEETASHSDPSIKSDTNSICSNEEKCETEKQPNHDHNLHGDLSCAQTSGNRLATPSSASTTSTATSLSSEYHPKVDTKCLGGSLDPLPLDSNQYSSILDEVCQTSSDNSTPSLQESFHLSLDSQSSCSSGKSLQVDKAADIGHLSCSVHEKNSVEWHLIIENTASSSKMAINHLCASAFEETYQSGLIWMSCSVKAMDCQALNFLSSGVSKLIYYPGFEQLRCPVSRNRKYKVGATKDLLVLLSDDGKLWYRTISQSTPLGTKWVYLATPKAAGKLISISICNKNSIGWFCDVNGNAWILRLKSKSWLPVKRDKGQKFCLESIFICPTDSSMVWSLDREGNLYVRTAIFDTKENGFIKGHSWLPVATPIRPFSVAVSPSSVWILDSSRIFRRKGISPPTNYVGREWIEVKPPTLVRDTLKMIAVARNDDIWLLTETGSVWQHCHQNDEPDEKYEDGWFIVAGTS